MGFFELLACCGLVALLLAGLVLGELIAFALVKAVLGFGGAAFGWLMDNVLDPAIARAESCLAAVWRRTRTPRRLIASVWRWTRPLRRTLWWMVRHPVKTSAGAVASILICGTTSVVWYVYGSAGEKPDIEVIVRWQPPTIGHIYDRNGAVIMRAYHEARVQLSATEFAHSRYDTMRNALIAAEDKRFLTHGGVDWRATGQEFAKAVWEKLNGRDGRGASSISQQLDRNIYPEIRGIVDREGNGTLTVDNIFTRRISRLAGVEWTNKAMRKFPEIRYAVWMERGLAERLGSKQAAKDMILATYANYVNLGKGVYGVEYGARHAFCKGADELEPHEAAYLASLIPAPNLYSRTDTPRRTEAAIGRRNQVLKRMAENGSISWERFAEERRKPLGFCPVPEGPKTEAPAAVKTALAEMKVAKGADGKELGLTIEDLNNGHVELALTVDLRIQRAVNRTAKRHIHGDPKDTIPGFAGTYPGVKTPQVAIVVMRANGEMLAMHGGFTESFYGYPENNRAMEAWPPTGSAFKAAVIAAIIGAGIHPDDIVYDERVCVRKNLAGDQHCFDNYKNEYQGAVSFRKASAESLNGAFMSTALKRAGGVSAVIAWARELGITSRLQPYPPTILGSNGVRPIEMAKVFSRLASGLTSEPFVVDRITSRTGVSLLERDPRVKRLRIPGTGEPVPSGMLNEMQQMLRGNVRLPTGTARSLNDSAKFPIQVMCKTGTANEHRAAWLGCSTYGPDGSTVVAWAGYDDYSPLPNEGLPIHLKATGGSLLGPMVREIFLAMYGNGKPLGEPPAMPDEIEMPIDEYLARESNVPLK